ncbi:MAG: acetoacetate decarboxylase family protein [Acidimicrobiia bacterium]
MTAPVAPWALSGEAIVAFVRRGRSSAVLPDGLAPLPGPVAVLAACYDGSPVGPYLELAVARPARLGPRPGWCVTTMAVDVPEARTGGRLNWGYPKELAELEWSSVDGVSTLRWPERGIVVAGTPTRLVVPVLAPLRSIQRRDDGPVVVPGGLRAMVRTARLSLTIPDDDPLAPLARDRVFGLHLGSLRLDVRPARHPRGWASSFRAPLRAPSPALTLASQPD